jgi:hypothetical protein
MFCRNCGKENAQGAAFCVSCGTKLEAFEPGQPKEAGLQPQTGQQSAQQQTNQAYTQPYVRQPGQYPVQIGEKPAKKKNAPAIALGVLSILLAAGLALSLLGVFGGAAGTFSAASKSFSTPEDAINYFVDRLKAGDFKGALAACGIDETVRGFDYKTYVERIQTLLPIATSFMPSEYEPYMEYNRARLTQQMLMQMTCFTVSLNLPEEFGGMFTGATMPLEDGKIPCGLMDALDPSKLSSLELVKTGKIYMHDDQNNRENQKKTAKTFGADDEQFRSVLYKYNGDYYLGGFTVIEYGGRWYINSMTDPLAGIPAFGTPIKISGEEEFDGMLE